MLFHTAYNKYFRENLRLFDAPDFIANSPKENRSLSTYPQRDYNISDATAYTPPAAIEFPINIKLQEEKLKGRRNKDFRG